MRFTYVKAGLWKRPIIPIYIRSKAYETGYLALLDSGADWNILHDDIAKILKIDLSKQKDASFSGIRREADATGKFAEVEISINGRVFFKTMVLFSNQISTSGYGILGQQGFFNHFSISFDYSKDLISVI